jgi:osmotically-inducible protein OsmY
MTDQLELDDGRVQFAPREEDELYTGRGPRNSAAAQDQVATQVCALMTAAGGLDASEIEVFVDGDEVTLEGTVATEEEYRLAENVALAVSLVRAVHNRLIVQAKEDA